MRQEDPQYGDCVQVTCEEPSSSLCEAEGASLVGRSAAYAMDHAGVAHEVIYHHIIPQPGRKMHASLAALPYAWHRLRGCKHSDVVAEAIPLQCAQCGKRVDGKLRCARCGRGLYCGKDCQKQHWPVHRRSCWRLPPLIDLFHDTPQRSSTQVDRTRGKEVQCSGGSVRFVA
ncbi:hypothetical protein WJX72_005202 [[Myrmecia] bisecta]|uniref:MYND-type domain-containing protein n=1 Tax=[Myrmecia] bisecta TaxID=41462 RepID=A0AAW1QF01_9CHLO